MPFVLHHINKLTPNFKINLILVFLLFLKMCKTSLCC
jgi:hypothetical protein